MTIRQNIRLRHIGALYISWAVATTAVALNAGLAIGQSATAPQTQGQGVEVAASVREIARKFAPQVEPVAQLRLIRGTIEGGGGGSGKSSSERQFERLEDGFWGISAVSRGKAVFVRRWITLQGLVILAGITEVADESENMTLLPFGRGFIPVSLAKIKKFSASAVTTKLSGDLETLVRPILGSKFSFEQTSDSVTQVTTSGLFGRTRNQSSTTTVLQSCIAEKEDEATTLHSKLRGKYLLVTCNRKQPDGKTKVDRFAFLPENNIYIMLSTFVDGVGDTYTIDEVEYAN